MGHLGRSNGSRGAPFRPRGGGRRKGKPFSRAGDETVLEKRIQEFVEPPTPRGLVGLARSGRVRVWTTRRKGGQSTRGRGLMEHRRYMNRRCREKWQRRRRASGREGERGGEGGMRICRSVRMAMWKSELWPGRGLKRIMIIEQGEEGGVNTTNTGNQ